MPESPSPSLTRSLVGRTISVDPFPGGPKELHVDAEVLMGPYTELWKATDKNGRVFGLRMLPQREVHADAWQNVLRIGKCDNKHIAGVYGRVRVDGVHGIVREWVDGRPLDTLWHERAKLTEIEEVFRQILDAVKAGHQAGVVHGGLKPSRILLDRGTQSLKVLDFAMGPWLPPRPEDGPWLAPERRRSFEADERGDIYALGALLYWLATNTIPATTPVPVRRLRPDLPDGLMKAIEGSMHPERGQRFLNCGNIQELVGHVRNPTSRISIIHAPALETAAEGEEPDMMTAEELIHGVGGQEPDTMSGKGAVLPPVAPPVPTPIVIRADPLVAPTEKPAEPVENWEIPRWAYGLVAGLLVIMGLCGAYLYWLQRPAPPPLPPKTIVPNPPISAPPITIPTVFEFAGSTQPDSIVVTCEGYQDTVPIVRGRAVVNTIPDVAGCTMYPMGVSVQSVVPVSQKMEYHCTIDRDILSCSGRSSGTH